MAGLLDRSLEALVEAAAACGDPSGRARRLGTASLIAWDLGMFEVARRHLGEARAVLAGVPPGQAHVYVTEIELRHSGRAGDRRPRDDAIAMMQRLAAATGSARARAILMYGQVMQDIDGGQMRRALSRLEEMLVLGAGLDDPLFIERAMRPMAEAWLCSGDLEAAADAALEGVRMARLCGVPTLEAGHLTHLSLVESSRGRYQQALRLAAEVIEIGERSAMARAITFGMAAQALTLVRQERYEHARDVLADVQARFGQWADADRHVFSVVDIARSMLALHRGDPAEAVAVSRACVQRLPALKVFLWPQTTRWRRVSVIARLELSTDRRRRRPTTRRRPAADHPAQRRYASIHCAPGGGGVGSGRSNTETACRIPPREQRATMCPRPVKSRSSTVTATPRKIVWKGTASSSTIML